VSRADDQAPDDEMPEGYAWDFARQERELPEEEFQAHIHLLDEVEEEDLEDHDLTDVSDYVLWAAAQAFEEFERSEEAIGLLKRIARSTKRHPALDYPAILLRLAERLKDRGDYDEAKAAVDDAARLDPGLRDRCDERRAEILVLRGRLDEGLDLFRQATTAFPGDPWVPLRAAWALMALGRYDDLPAWIETAEKALKDVTDETEARQAADEIDRLRTEATERAARRGRVAPADAGQDDDQGAGRDSEPGAGPAPDLESVRQDILAALHQEEARLIQSPPRSPEDRERAAAVLAALHARASRAWDDAVEAKQEPFIAAFDDLQWDVAGLAERFGIDLPGIDED
jgi:tetratricopeptide (TPR) repeat protein